MVRSRVPRFAAVWAGSFVLVALLGVVWALAAPLSGPPDEPTHIIHAYAIFHGQLIGSEDHPAAITDVTVPKCLSRLFTQRDHAIGDWVSRRRR